MKQQKTLTTSVILALIFFFPLGLFLLYRNLTSNSFDMLKNAKITKNFGIGFLVFGAMCLITSPQAKFENGESAIFLWLVFGLVFLALGGYMFQLSGKILKRANQYRKYVGIITGQQVSSLDKIAHMMAADYSTVAADLTKMLELGYFEGAYIDEVARKIVLPAVVTVKPHLISVHCEACGANNMIAENTIGNCEYCGAPLHA